MTTMAPGLRAGQPPLCVRPRAHQLQMNRRQGWLPAQSHREPLGSARAPRQGLCSNPGANAFVAIWEMFTHGLLARSPTCKPGTYRPGSWG